MDDTHTPLKTNSQDSSNSAKSGQAGSPQVSVPSLNKESEPTTQQAKEVMEPIRAPEINPEVLDYIEQREKMTVPPDLKNIGVQTTDDVHGSTGPSFPISDEKIEEGLHQPVNSSWRWLSEFLLYHLKQAHLTLKKVHGHIVRVARG